MIVRNTKACCGNCPFWNQLPEQKGADGKPLILGECRERIPDVVVYPKAQPPSIARPNAAGGMAISIERVLFTPPPSFWCGQHPEFLHQIVDGPQ